MSRVPRDEMASNPVLASPHGALRVKDVRVKDSVSTDFRSAGETRRKNPSVTPLCVAAMVGLHDGIRYSKQNSSQHRLVTHGMVGC